jgi:hypothetical protein
MTETNHLSMPAIAFIYGAAPAYIRYHCDLIYDNCYADIAQRDLVSFAELLVLAFESEKATYPENKSIFSISAEVLKREIKTLTQFDASEEAPNARRKHDTPPTEAISEAEFEDSVNNSIQNQSRKMQYLRRHNLAIYLATSLAKNLAAILKKAQSKSQSTRHLKHLITKQLDAQMQEQERLQTILEHHRQSRTAALREASKIFICELKLLKKEEHVSHPIATPDPDEDTAKTNAAQELYVSHQDYMRKVRYSGWIPAIVLADCFENDLHLPYIDLPEYAAVLGATCTKAHEQDADERPSFKIATRISEHLVQHHLSGKKKETAEQLIRSLPNVLRALLSEDLTYKPTLNSLRPPPTTSQRIKATAWLTARHEERHEEQHEEQREETNDKDTYLLGLQQQKAKDIISHLEIVADHITNDLTLPTCNVVFTLGSAIANGLFAYDDKTRAHANWGNIFETADSSRRELKENCWFPHILEDFIGDVMNIQPITNESLIPTLNAENERRASKSLIAFEQQLSILLCGVLDEMKRFRTPKTSDTVDFSKVDPKEVKNYLGLYVNHTEKQIQYQEDRSDFVTVDMTMCEEQFSLLSLLVRQQKTGMSRQNAAVQMGKTSDHEKYENNLHQVTAVRADLNRLFKSHQIPLIISDSRGGRTGKNYILESSTETSKDNSKH